jgi:hypothetical protein
MMNSGRLFPGSTLVIEDVLRGETAEDTAAVRPALVQLRASADRPVPVPSVELQRLLDLGTGRAVACADVTQLDAFRAHHEGKGSRRYGTKRRAAVTSMAVFMLLGAGTGVAAAVDSGVRQQIATHVASVGAVLAPRAPAPATVVEVVPEVPDTAPLTPAPVGTPAAPVAAPVAPSAAVEAPAPTVEVQPAPEVAEVPAKEAPRNSGNAEGPGGAAAGNHKGTDKAEVKAPAVSPGQAKKAVEGVVKSAKGKARDRLKELVLR